MKRFFAACAAAAVVSFPAIADDAVRPSTTVGAPDVAEPTVTAPVLVQASGYAAYLDDVGSLRARSFTSADDLDSALEMMSAHRPEQLARSWIAYNALVGATAEDFGELVRITADAHGVDAVAGWLRGDPSYATAMWTAAGRDGPNPARQAVLRKINQDAATIRSTGERVRYLNYENQSGGWGVASSGNNQVRLARLEAVPARQMSPTRLASLSTFTANLRVGPATAQAATYSLAENPNHAFAVDQAVALAALHAIGAVDSATQTDLDPFLSNPSTQDCLVAARLTLNSCIRVSHKRYEDFACLGNHAMTEVATCLARVVQ